MLGSGQVALLRHLMPNTKRPVMLRGTALEADVRVTTVSSALEPVGRSSLTEDLVQRVRNTA
jgi:hypothetical protein